MLKTFPKGGIHPEENKLSAGKLIEILPLPKTFVVAMSQHIGAPAVPTVKTGDKVKTGQLIGQGREFVSANVHSPISGTVIKIEEYSDITGYKKMSVIIECEGDVWEEGILKTPSQNIESFEPAYILERIKDAGIVGLGGATFPTHIKAMIPKDKTAEWILINGAECEPYLTCDHALMLEKPIEIIKGLQLLMKALNVKHASIGIEKNKPDAIQKLKNEIKNQSEISITALQLKYPQGGEKQLIKAILNREVPSGKLPIDVGVVVFNISTVYAVYEAVYLNKPLFERLVTITGKDCIQPKNVWVRIGTPISQLLEYAGGLPDSTGKIINGGPMMGKSFSNISAPVTKGCSGILTIPEKEAPRKKMSDCIRCGKCVGVCPMGLEPYLLMHLGTKEMNDELESNKVTDCLECGCCSYECPSNRPLLDHIRLGKSNVIKIIRNRKK